MCGEIGATLAGELVKVAGWVWRRRDHGGLIFIDLRDRTGAVQLVFSPERSAEAYRIADSARAEYVVSCQGVVKLRPEGRKNPNIPTGEIEIQPSSIELLNPSKTPPLYIEDDSGVDETVRLRYRYVDLRRPLMHQKIALRHRITMATRSFLDREGFLEIETPMLTRSTPEGARDYLVPSRVNPGEFYALPQSPQLFKQLLMVAGMDRYFQIVRCFRDEDLRADRQPEFTQIDIEMSFITREDIVDLTERLVCHVYEQALGVKLPRPFRRIEYDEAIARYGSDKPDLRFGMEIVDLAHCLKSSSFKIFYEAIAQGGTVRGIRVPGQGSLSRREIDDLAEVAKASGARGLLWVSVGGPNTRSSFSKFVTQAEMDALGHAMEASDGDLLLMAAGPGVEVSKALGALRLHLSRKLRLAAPGDIATCWVTDFPLFELDSAGSLTSSHHPFTSPAERDLDRFEAEPLQVKSNAYDLVINGNEVAGGSIRIWKRNIQERIFRTLGISDDEARVKFGFLLEAFEYGAPPHGGIAFGLDRFVMVLAGEENIRDVIAFPKTTSASDLMTGAPSPVPDDKLREVHIQLVRKPDKA